MKNIYHFTNYIIRYLYFSFFDARQAGYYKHLILRANKNHLLNHPIGDSSIVFDVGGYTGLFSEDIAKKFDPYLFVFEPIAEFCDEISSRFRANKKVKVCNFGLADRSYEADFYLNENGSSVFPVAQTATKVKMIDICQFVSDNNIEKIDLMTINIEGGEYDLLPRVLETGLINKIETLQIQFHMFDQSEFVKKRKEIVEQILATHRVKYSFPFTWECFSKS